MPTTLVMLMIRPARRLLMPRAACLIIRNAPLKFVSRTASQSSSLMRNTRLSRRVPALFTRMSIGPRSRSTSATAASTCSPWATSHAYPRADAPSRCAAACAPVPSRAITATFAPAVCSALAIACPMPRLPPVTSATFSHRSIFMRRSGRLEERGDVDRRAEAHYCGPGQDASQQTGEHASRADLEEPGALAGESRRVLHALDPADGRGELVHEQAARARRGRHGLGGRVGEHREARLAKLGAVEHQPQMTRGGRHQRRMEGAAHLERNHALRPAGLARRPRLGDRVRVSRDDGLIRGVQICGDGDGALARYLVA